MMAYRKIRAALALILGAVGLAGWTSAVAAERTMFYLGSEYYSWREYDDSGTRILEESGPRYFLGISDTKEMAPHWEMTFDMRMYAARVSYEGQTNSTPPQPFTTHTDYHGLSAELTTIGFLNDESAPQRWGVLGTLGVDAWQRDINSKLTVAGYTETYHISYGRLGLAVVGNAWRLEGGVKYPFATHEAVGLSAVGYDNAALSPTPAISAFASAHYRIDSRWQIIGYYDSYRFDKSPVKTLTSGGIPVGTVWQPKIEQDRYGLGFSYQF